MNDGGERNRDGSREISRGTLKRLLARDPRREDRAISYCGFGKSWADLEDMIWRFVEDDLTEPETEDLEAHAKGCAYCRSRVAAVSRVVETEGQTEESPALAAAAADLSISPSPNHHLVRIRRALGNLRFGTKSHAREIIGLVDEAGRWIRGEGGGALILVHVLRGPFSPQERTGPVPENLEEVLPTFEIHRTYPEGIEIRCRLEREGPVEKEVSRLALRVQCLESPGDQPLEGAEVVFRCDHSENSATTDADGRTVFQLDPEFTRLRLSVTCSSRAPVSLDIELFQPPESP